MPTHAESTLRTGDSIEVMATLPEASVDAVVTDPPYGLEFMGKDWDTLDTPDWYGRGAPPFGGGRNRVRYGTGNQQAWHFEWALAALRVAKPGAYLLAFGGTRTVHRMTVALEDAGWVIRDLLVWAYAQGFPKSRSSLKPAWEPIVLARKPGPLRELGIDAARIGTTKRVPESPRKGPHDGAAGGIYGQFGAPTPDTDGWDPNTGRWPANVILTDPVFDGGWEGVVGGGEARSPRPYVRSVAADGGIVGWNPEQAGEVVESYGDTGTYSRFFLVPKASRADREPVFGGLEERQQPGDFPAYVCNVCGSRRVLAGETTCGHGDQRRERGNGVGKPRVNGHPTVKPLALMRHLVRLVVPPGGTVLDPFLGSGTTAIAAEMEGMAWVGIEREPEYVAIAEARLQGVQRGMGLEATA